MVVKNFYFYYIYTKIDKLIKTFISHSLTIIQVQLLSKIIIVVIFRFHVYIKLLALHLFKMRFNFIIKNMKKLKNEPIDILI